MARCDSCGNECTLPFTCQHCGGKFCPDCRLPPNHQCSAIRSWKKKPVPGVGLRYGRGNSVTATSSGYAETRHALAKKRGRRIPWLMIMAAIIILILLVLFLMAFRGIIL
jgi:hypothetical protein